MAKTDKQLESVMISYNHIDQVADALWKRLQDDEKEQLIKLFIKKEASKKIEEAIRRSKPINTSVEEFTLDIEKRMLNKLIFLEAKQKIMARERA